MQTPIEECLPTLLIDRVYRFVKKYTSSQKDYMLDQSYAKGAAALIDAPMAHSTAVDCQCLSRKTKKDELSVFDMQKASLLEGRPSSAPSSAQMQHAGRRFTL